MYRIVEKFHGRIFCNFTLKQAFQSINFAICMPIFRICALIVTISQINFRKLDQIVKKFEIFNLMEISCYTVDIVHIDQVLNILDQAFVPSCSDMRGPTVHAYQEFKQVAVCH